MKKILFIEDEPEQIMVMKVRLEASGYAFISAMDGEEGIEKARGEKPDLILLDLILPKMNGYEVAKRLRGDPNTCDIPIIVVTASGAEKLEEKCRAVGADVCIRKPYDAAEVLQKIRERIGE